MTKVPSMNQFGDSASSDSDGSDPKINILLSSPVIFSWTEIETKTKIMNFRFTKTETKMKIIFKTKTK